MIFNVMENVKEIISKHNDKGEISNISSRVTEEFFRKENWKYRKGNINLVIENNKMIIESKKNRVTYLSLFETNTNFNRAPKQKKRIMLNKNTLFRLNGSNPQNINATVFVIEYGANRRRLNTNRLFINREKEIMINPRTEYIRIAIRIEGKGEISLSNFKLIQDYIPAQNISKKDTPLKDITEIKMACIFDEFSMESFSKDITLLTFTPDNWINILSKNKPDLLMVESAWRGNFGSWEYQVGKYNNNEGNKKLKQLLSWCKKQRIPTVFWNKEDPVHFEKFINVASLFDYIFTTDSNMINQYQEAAGHKQVYAMQFAASPLEHNPIRSPKAKENKISFAGSYYANRHIDRRKDMDEMLEVTKQFGLDIYDRNFERNKLGNSHFMFPKDLRENIVGTLKYSQISKAYKDYRLILNVNSVKESPTMFSRRVFEGLACGTPIISSYSIGIKKTFNDIVVVSEDTKDLKIKINELMTDDKKYRELAMKGIREVYRHHTYLHRIKFILDKLGISYRNVEKDITVIFSVNTIEDFHKALHVTKLQSYRNIYVILLIPLFSGYEVILNKYNNGKIFTFIKDYAFKYEDITDLITTKYVTVMDIKNEYGRHYLEDLIHAGTYSRADIIGKKVLYNQLENDYSEYEYEYVNSIIRGTAIYKVDILKNISLLDFIQNEEALIERLFKERGARIFSSDKYNIKINK